MGGALDGQGTEREDDCLGRSTAPPTKPRGPANPTKQQSAPRDTGRGPGTARGVPPTCRWKYCRDKTGPEAQHTIFQCPLTNGIIKPPDTVDRMLQVSGICKKCARLTTECEGNCGGNYQLRNGTKKSGLCDKGCKQTNRTFCAHSKLRGGQGGTRQAQSQTTPGQHAGRPRKG